MIDASRCPDCERVDVPPRQACAACASNVEPMGIEPEGRVLAHTQRPGKPRVVLVELDHQARVTATSPDELAIGDPVRVKAGATYSARARE